MANPASPDLDSGNEVKPYLLYTLTGENADKFPRGDAMRRVLQRALEKLEVIVIEDGQSPETFQAIRHFILDSSTTNAVDVTQLPGESFEDYIERLDQTVSGKDAPQVHKITDSEVDFRNLGRALDLLEHEEKLSPSTRVGVLAGFMRALSEAAAKQTPRIENRQGDFYVLVRDGSIAERHYQENN